MANSDFIIDINEDVIYDWGYGILDTLLLDHTTGKNIYWATNDYSDRGEGFSFYDEITVENITGFNLGVITPRFNKTKFEQRERSRDKAEVFTPAWVCNAQNNLIDDMWFKRANVFNTEVIENGAHTWIPTDRVSEFPREKTWKKYVKAQRLEMACGEAPYLCSRYDAATGDYIDLKNRIGFLDRKMRLIKENVLEQPSDPAAQWRNWSFLAYKSIYGFDYQGDSLLLARESLLFSYIDYFQDKWGYFPAKGLLKEVAEIISWNLWQMDGFTYGLPGYCPSDNSTVPEERFCKIMDWDMKYRKEGGEEVVFKSIVK